MGLSRIAAVAVLSALALAACGADEPVGEAVGAPAPAEGGGVRVEAADLGEVGGALEDEWGVDCGEELVDMAGFTKRVCGIPDELMSPGMSSNGIGLHAFTEQSQVDMFRDSYVTEGDGFAQGEGWFLQAPSQEIADQAAVVING